MLHPAYVAGLFDGEGSASLIYSVRRYRLDGKTPMSAFLLRILLTNTHKGIIEQLKEQFGGGISHQKGRTKRHKENYHWALSGAARQRAFLEMMLPFLVIKKRAAEISLQFLTTVGPVGSRVPQEYWEIRTACYVELRSLNRRGDIIAAGTPTASPPEGWRPSKRHDADGLIAFMKHVRGEE